MWEAAWLLLAGVALGTVMGTFTGLVPGVHVNTVAPVALGIALAGGSSLAAPAALFVVTLAVVHTIVNVIPTLAAPLPEDDTALSLLPIQRLAKAGFARRTLVASVRASWLGGLGAVAVLVALFVFWSGAVAQLPRRLAVQLIIAVIVMLVLRHRNPARCLLSFFLAGAAGLTLLGTTMVGPLGGDGTILLPAFAALFGAPLLLLTLREPRPATGKQPPLDDTEAPAALAPPPPPSRLATWTGTACGMLVALVPGLTSATAGALGRSLRRPRDDLEDVTMLSAVDTANVIGNTGALLVWGATRSGASVAVQQIWPRASGVGGTGTAGLMLAAMVAALALGSWVSLTVGPGLVQRLRAVDPKTMALGALVLLALIVALHGGLFAMLVTVCLLPLGLLPHKWGTPRALLMGFLIVPYLVRAVPAL